MKEDRQWLWQCQAASTCHKHWSSSSHGPNIGQKSSPQSLHYSASSPWFLPSNSVQKLTKKLYWQTKKNLGCTPWGTHGPGLMSKLGILPYCLWLLLCTVPSRLHLLLTHWISQLDNPLGSWKLRNLPNRAWLCLMRETMLSCTCAPLILTIDWRDPKPLILTIDWRYPIVEGTLYCLNTSSGPFEACPRPSMAQSDGHE